MMFSPVFLCCLFLLLSFVSSSFSPSSISVSTLLGRSYPGDLSVSRFNPGDGQAMSAHSRFARPTRPSVSPLGDALLFSDSASSDSYALRLLNTTADRVQAICGFGAAHACNAGANPIEASQLASMLTAIDGSHDTVFLVQSNRLFLSASFKALTESIDSTEAFQFQPVFQPGNGQCPQNIKPGQAFQFSFTAADTVPLCSANSLWFDTVASSLYVLDSVFNGVIRLNFTSNTAESLFVFPANLSFTAANAEIAIQGTDLFVTSGGFVSSYSFYFGSFTDFGLFHDPITNSTASYIIPTYGNNMLYFADNQPKLVSMTNHQVTPLSQPDILLTPAQGGLGPMDKYNQSFTALSQVITDDTNDAIWLFSNHKYFRYRISTDSFDVLLGGGNNGAGYQDGDATTAMLYQPYGLTSVQNKVGEALFVDGNGIRHIDDHGIVTTLYEKPLLEKILPDSQAADGEGYFVLSNPANDAPMYYFYVPALTLTAIDGHSPNGYPSVDIYRSVASAVMSPDGNYMYVSMQYGRINPQYTIARAHRITGSITQFEVEWSYCGQNNLFYPVNMTQSVSCQSFNPNGGSLTMSADGTRLYIIAHDNSAAGTAIFGFIDVSDVNNTAPEISFSPVPISNADTFYPTSLHRLDVQSPSLPSDAAVFAIGTTTLGVVLANYTGDGINGLPNTQISLWNIPNVQDCTDGDMMTQASFGELRQLTAIPIAPKPDGTQQMRLLISDFGNNKIRFLDFETTTQSVAVSSSTGASVETGAGSTADSQTATGAASSSADQISSAAGSESAVMPSASESESQSESQSPSESAAAASSSASDVSPSESASESASGVTSDSSAAPVQSSSSSTGTQSGSGAGQGAGGSDGDDNGSKKAIIIVVVIILVLAAGGVGYWYYRRRMAQSRRAPLSLNAIDGNEDLYVSGSQYQQL